MRGIVAAVGLVAVIAVAPVVAEAQDVTLGFATLPSAQGWNYSPTGVDAGAVESSVFSVGAGTLVSNTMGRPFNTGGGGIQYVRPHSFTAQPVVLTMRARVTNNEGATGNACFGFGFNFGFATGTHYYQVGLTTSQIRDQCGSVIGTIDNTVFHEYRLQCVPGNPGSLFVDNVLVGTVAPFLDGAPSQLYLGDGTGSTNARAEITSYKFTHLSYLPGPAGFWLVALAALLLLAGMAWMTRASVRLENEPV